MEPAEFVSEPVKPDFGTADAASMARGIPGLPTGFTWRDRHYAIRAVLSSWKRSESENHRPSGEKYYRKHYYKVSVDTGEVMTLYAVRHVKVGENPNQRWWLQSIERDISE
ncbi:MAG: cytoplasmic protein [Phycisphaerales bacterium]|nr:cytoplasmic protein [Phycisphaerales bacterium]MCB9856440.1 cytoplasmic protein [Phycisphaerales bacterium]